MLNSLPPDVLVIRSHFLRNVRTFFHDRGYLEMETPLLNPTENMEPFIDAFMVKREILRKGPDLLPPLKLRKYEELISENLRYLITSPEYNLKILLSELRQNLFQIAHSFRMGDRGDHHTEEFLLLEWYRIDADDRTLMDESEELIRFLSSLTPGDTKISNRPFSRFSVNQLLEQFAGCTMARPDLEKAVLRHGLLGPGEDPTSLRYDELFFSVFLNLVEGNLPAGDPVFVCDYPPELAANSRVINGVARRFEIYWNRIELANGYFEIDNFDDQLSRFDDDNRIRVEMNRNTALPDPQLMDSLSDTGLPLCSGIAVGLDRLLMVLTGKEKLSEISVFL